MSASASRILLLTAESWCCRASHGRGSLCAVAFTFIEADLETFGWRLTMAMAGLRSMWTNDSCNVLVGVAPHGASLRHCRLAPSLLGLR